ncbi:hypothetical protein MBCUT_14960 [Methanobrevibacter cuticularis]|uniref:Uncharacterized protein n=1 Tax=Methanobrevibacter cuticularis TaxID=47311 RepID=A0A166DE63_9EURY|nr:hypothetical protein [Methanobrevibacter cuticularis]KZX15499.1 hypothetical protein MBCUT_14960 [Methanobrevibacter cuticularis]
MIEDKIQVLRKAAKVSNEQSSERMWCVIAGNKDLVNDIAYAAIASKERVKILFREHVTLEDSYVIKKFDFLMLYGESDKIRDLSYICKDNGGAYIQIAPYYITNEPNLMLLVAPDNVIKQFVGDIERMGSEFSILLEDQTTGFIETDLQINTKLPAFINSMLAPLFNLSDVVLSTILISTGNKEDVEKIQEIATANKIFIIDFKDIIVEG